MLRILVFLSTFAVSSPDICAQTIRYVRPSATGSGDGSSWADAAGDFQSMINASAEGDEVWVAAGTYTPATSTGYTMKEGVKIYGGFPATGAPAFSDRSWQTNTTVLRGYAPLNNTTSQRVIDNAGTGLTAAALLDGFTITGGILRGLFEHGAGMYNINASPTVQNCIFTNNNAQGEGGGVYNAGSSPTFINCTFSSNTSSYLTASDPSGSGGGMANYYSHPTLTGCNFKGNKSNTGELGGGGGLFNINSNPILTNCTFSDNFGYRGGGIYNNASSPVLNNCSFLSNKGVYGGAVYNYQSPPGQLISCTFADNSAASGGAFFNRGGSYIHAFTNCVFNRNLAIAGGGNGKGAVVFNYDASSNFYNCVLTGNISYDDPAVIYAFDWKNSDVYNSVIYGNSGALTRRNIPQAPVVIHNSLVQGYSFLPGNPSGNIDGATDPLFTDAANPTGADGVWGTADDGLRLQACSPLIGTGNNALATVSTDILGNARIQNGSVDIGAYESNYLTASGSSLFVNGSVAASGTGTAWTSPLKTLTEALAAASQCSSIENIFVAGGAYYPTGTQNGTDRNATFLIPQRGGIKIYGGYNAATGIRNISANPTILSGDIGTPGVKADNSYHVMVMTGTLAGADSVVIDGFTITGGNADSGTQHTYNGVLTGQNEGGGLLLRENDNIGDKITVRNCTITGNAASVAGGLYMWASSALVHHTVISANTASGDGGGVFIYATSAPKIVNSVISNNTAANGGGIYSFHEATSLSIINTTIIDNTATGNGNNIHNHTGATINMSNAIVWGGDAAKNIHNEATFNAANSDILKPTGVYPGTGNINADPMFIDPADGDYTPSPCSPVVNAGNNATVNNAPSGSAASDIVGKPRIFGISADIGAYELQIAAGAPAFTITTPASHNICLGSGFPELELKGENGQVCFIIDENATQTITAPAGAVFSDIIFASYGAASGNCETGFTRGSCHAANSSDVVRNLASGHNSFTITASNATFGGDPCNGNLKKLYVKLSYVYPTIYTWTNNNTGIGLAASGTGNIPAFTPANTGTATITVTPTNAGCAVSPVIFTYTVNPVPSATTAQVHVSCYGNKNGSATITNVNGGTAPYTYLWNTNSVNASITGLIAGNYSCTIQDARGCSVAETFTITQPAAALTASASQIDVRCNGDHTGSAAITDVSGGTAPYAYLWNTGAVTSSIENIAAGTYSCTVTDANHCTIVRSFTITQPLPLVASTSQTDISCFGANNGEVSVNVSGGIFPYTYLWNTGAVTASPTNLTAGTYSCTIEDANGCTIVKNITLTQPDLLTVLISKIDPDCDDEASATASVAASGGTSPYTYLWNTGAVTASITNLTVGHYSCTIKDAKGCEVVKSITIASPANPFLVVAVAADNHASCRGGSDGKATASVNGGTGSYTYQWSNGATGAIASDLAAGTYTCTVRDGGGCEITRTIVISQPAELVATTAAINADCDGGGTASVTAGGGTAPYTYLWSNGATGPSVENLPTGDYTYTITDAKGCLITKEFTIGWVQLIVPPAPKSVCFGNNATAVNFASPDITGGTQLCFIINEGQTQTITAPAGQVFTSVLFASYGNASGDCTNGFATGSCHAANSRSIIESRALGNNSFTVTASNAVFGGDPCFGTAKKLYIILAYTDPGASAAYSYSWTNDNPSIGLPASGTGGLIPSFTPLTSGVANITLTASLTGCDISETATFAYTVVNKESLFVDGSVSTSGDGKSWGTAFKTLQEALAAARNSAQCGVGSIKVAKGVYMPAGGQYFSMIEGAKIWGGYPSGGGERDISHNQTILKANGNNYIISNDNNGLTAAALLDGFTFSGKGGSNYPAMYNYNVSPTISNCVFVNNTAGAMYNSGAHDTDTLTISNCVFSDNGNLEYPTTGGIENAQSRILIVNCLFSGNKAYVGGAVASYSSEGVIVNCTFYNNSSTDSHYQSHAMYNGGSFFTLANNIFAGHSGSSVFDDNGTSEIRNSLIEDAAYANYSSPGYANIQASPRFVNAADPVGPDGIWGTADDGLKLQASSPAVDGGLKNHYTNHGGGNIETDTDLSGDLRLRGENVDMGAYEFYSSAPLPVRWISFGGDIGEGQLATLQWKAEETKARHYELQRSADARTFRHVTEIPAAGHGIAAYQFTDPLPVDGAAYYRIRQVDLDGALSYSRIISVRSASHIAFRAWPNPAGQAVTVELDPGQVGRRIRLVSSVGIVLQEINVTERVFSVSLDGYPAGIYLLHTADGKMVKLVKE